MRSSYLDFIVLTIMSIKQNMLNSISQNELLSNILNEAQMLDKRFWHVVQFDIYILNNNVGF